MISAKNLEVGFTEENGGRTLINTVKTGQVVLLPQDLIHYQQNRDCNSAYFLATINSDEALIISPAARIFTLPDDIIAKNFGVTEAQVEQSRNGLPFIVSKPDEECLSQCEISYEYNSK